jgi:hypothetical protein
MRYPKVRLEEVDHPQSRRQIIRIELSRYAAVVGFRVVVEAVYDPIGPADAGGTAAPQLL